MELLLFSLLSFIASATIPTFFSRMRDRRTRFLLMTFSRYMFLSLGIALLWLSLNIRISATVIGIVGGVLIYVLQKPILNLIGWLYIVFQQPFTVGDTIEIDGKLGDVFSIDLFTTRMRMLDSNFLPTGTSISIPNERFIYSETTNYSYPTEMIWDSVEFSFTYESDLRMAERIVIKAIEENIAGFRGDIAKVFSTRKEYLKYRKEFPMVYRIPAESGVVVGAKYLVPLSQKFETRSAITNSVIEAVKRSKRVEFAYPHVVVVRKGRN